MSADPIEIVLSSPQQTADFAARLGAHLQSGDVILMTGDVGAGKTHFARALIQSLLTTPEDVPSPTFTLVQTYHAAQAEIWHADLYRLTSTFEIEELGLIDAFEEAICLVEWPDRLGELRPKGALDLTFSAGIDPDTRTLRIGWEDARWSPMVRAWLG